jgi:hypothetical protein
MVAVSTRTIAALRSRPARGTIRQRSPAGDTDVSPLPAWQVQPVVSVGNGFAAVQPVHEGDLGSIQPLSVDNNDPRFGVGDGSRSVQQEKHSDQENPHCPLASSARETPRHYGCSCFIDQWLTATMAFCDSENKVAHGARGCPGLFVNRPNANEVTGLTTAPTRQDAEGRMFADLEPATRAFATYTPHRARHDSAMERAVSPRDEASMRRLPTRPGCSPRCRRARGPRRRA